MKALFIFLQKFGQTGALTIGVVAIAIVLISIYAGIGSAGYELSSDLNGIMKNADDADSKDIVRNIFSATIWIAIILLVITFIAAIVSGVTGLVTFPKASLKGLAGVGVLAVIFLVIYFMQSGEATGRLSELMQKFSVSDNASKLISAGIITTILLTVGALVAMVLGEIRNAFK